MSLRCLEGDEGFLTIDTLLSQYVVLSVGTDRIIHQTQIDRPIR
jgi:hypothetical protein